MKRYFLSLSLLTSLYFSANCQPPEGQTANANYYDSEHVKDRSRKSHKKSDKIKNKNNKNQEKANKKAEQERKDKLSGKKKENDSHQFPH